MVSPDISRHTAKSSSGDALSSSRCVTKKDLLRPNDVLFGRGTGPNERIGNIRFRALVQDVIQSFGAKGLVGKTKSRLADVIIKKVKARGGRFVRRVEYDDPTEIQKNRSRAGDHYEEVTDALALDKIKQSFRHQLRATKHLSSTCSSDDICQENGKIETANKGKVEQGLDYHKGSKRETLPDSIILQQSLPISSGEAAVLSPSQRGYLVDGILQLKALQHDSNDSSFSTAPGPATSSLFDPHTFMGLQQPLLPSLPSVELMRKEIASRYLLAESILLGDDSCCGILAQSLIANSQHFRRREGLPMGLSSLYMPTAGMQHPLDSIRFHQQCCPPSTARQCRLPTIDADHPLSLLLESTRGFAVPPISPSSVSHHPRMIEPTRVYRGDLKQNIG